MSSPTHSPPVRRSAPRQGRAVAGARGGGRQRGFSLVIAVAIFALLSMMGVMVLDAVYTDTQMAGGDRAGQNVLYVSEAGLVWGRQRLEDLMFPLGSSNTAPQVTALMAQTPLMAGDVMCPDNVVCTNWFLLQDWLAYGAGEYRVAATCQPVCSTVNPPSAFTVRAVGRTPDGARRMLELTVGP